MSDWVEEDLPDCRCIVWHTCQDRTANGTDVPAEPVEADQ